MSSEHALFQFHAWNGRREDFLAASSRIVPERMDKVIITGQSLVVTDELQTVPINRSTDSGVPTLSGDADVFEE